MEPNAGGVLGKDPGLECPDALPFGLGDQLSHEHGADALAAPFLIEYINLISNAGSRADIPIRCFMPDTRGWLTLADMKKC